MAAKAKYAGLKGDIVLLQTESQIGGQKSGSGFPARSAVVRRLAEKKGCFGGRFADPFAKLILTWTAQAVPDQIKNKKLGNPGINLHRAGGLLTPLQH